MALAGRYVCRLGGRNTHGLERPIAVEAGKVWRRVRLGKVMVFRNPSTGHTPTPNGGTQKDLRKAPPFGNAGAEVYGEGIYGGWKYTSSLLGLTVLCLCYLNFIINIILCDEHVWSYREGAARGGRSSTE